MPPVPGSHASALAKDAADKAMLDRFNVNLDISGSLGEGSGSQIMGQRRMTHHAGSSSKGRMNMNPDISHSMDSGDFNVSASGSQMSRISGRGANLEKK